MTAQPYPATVGAPRAFDWQTESPTSPIPVIGTLPAAAPYGTGPFAGPTAPDHRLARHRRQAVALAVLVAILLVAALLTVLGVL